MEYSLREVSRLPRLVVMLMSPKWRQEQTKVQTKVQTKKLKAGYV